MGGIGALDFEAVKSVVAGLSEAERDDHAGDAVVGGVVGDGLKLVLAEAVECGVAGIAVDGEEFLDGDGGVEGEFGEGVIAGAEDFDEEVGATLPVGAAVDGVAVVADDDDVGAAVVMLPVLVAIADIGPGENDTPVFFRDDFIQCGCQGGDNRLMDIVGEWGHDVNSVPDFIVFVAAELSSLADEGVGNVGVEDFHDHGGGSGSVGCSGGSQTDQVFGLASVRWISRR